MPQLAGAPLLVSALCACVALEPDLGASSSSESGTDPGESETTGTDESPAPTVSLLRGRVVDIEGVGLPGAGVQLLGPVSEDAEYPLHLAAPVRADGWFEFTVPRAGLWAVRAVHPPLDGRVFSGAAAHVLVELGQEAQLPQDLVVPEVDTLVDFSDAQGEVSLELDPHLHLGFDSGELIGSAFQEIDALGAVAVAPSLNLNSNIAGMPVLAAWAFAPFSARLMEGYFSIELGELPGFDPGDSVKVYENDPTVGQIHLIAQGTVSEGGEIALSPLDHGLQRLGWLLVTH